MLEQGNRMKAVQLRAVLPEAESAISEAGRFMTGRGLDELKPGEQGLILGQGVASKLGVGIGDSLTLLLPQPDTRITSYNVCYTKLLRCVSS